MTAAPGIHRLILRPGVPVLARAPGVIQVGLDEPAIRLADDPEVLGLLRGLARPGGVDLPEKPSPSASAALDRLERAGLVIAVPASERGTQVELALLRAQFGPDAVRRRAARAGAAIVVRADAAMAPGTHETLADLLDEAGLHSVPASDPRASVHLVVTSGPVDRARLDPLVRSSVPHLLLSGSGSGRRIGPFVQPGLTACVRCVDAHEALHDPRRPLLLAQAATAAQASPPPQDPVLDRLALAWTVRDLQRYAEGDEPSTWSSTIDVGPVSAPEVTRWGRHPDCGCAWDQFTELP